jgi:hypothetical protein
VDRSQGRLSQNHVASIPRTSPQVKTRSNKLSSMFKSKNIPIFVLFGLVHSVLATLTPTAEFRAVESETHEEEPFRDLWYGDQASYEYFFKPLKDWSYYNYSSLDTHARNSYVRWGGKFYDPLSFKGGENDSYGKALQLTPFSVEINF